MKNPYQEVIDWLRSPEGSEWSEKRMRDARTFENRAGEIVQLHTLNNYGYRVGPLFLAGVLSVKEN